MNFSAFAARHRLAITGLLQLLVCGTGSLLLWYATNRGVGVSPDSAEYIAAARRLHSLPGLFNLPAHWAPGYPVLLKLANWLSGLDILTSTRVLQCLLLAANLAAAMTLLRHVCGRHSMLPLLGGIVLLCSFNLWQVNFYAWSEGPFLLCQQLSLLCLLRFLEAPALLRHLLAAALLAAMAWLFRYAGIAWIGTLGLVLLVLPSLRWQQRLRNALLFGVVAAAPFVVWIVANYFIRHETTDRQLVVHLPDATDLLILLGQMLSWVGLTRTLALSAIAMVLTAAVLWLALRGRYRQNVRLRWLLLISLCHTVVYTLFILASKSFFDAYLPFDERILVAAWLFVTLAVLACAIQLLELGSRTQLLAALALFVMAASGALQLVPMIIDARQQGVGYLAYMAQVSPVEDVPQLRDKKVYSNAPDFLRMKTDLDVHDYPRKFISTTLQANPNYADEVASMRQQAQAGQALLVHYQAFEWRNYYPSHADLSAAGFETVLSGSQVVILSSPVAVPNQ
jgi:4-amino-4-deoxy-L-arabinose transferase-like glycosyltransferase